jgi:hypothetical protein
MWQSVLWLFRPRVLAATLALVALASAVSQPAHALFGWGWGNGPLRALWRGRVWNTRWDAQRALYSHGFGWRPFPRLAARRLGIWPRHYYY